MTRSPEDLLRQSRPPTPPMSDALRTEIAETLQREAEMETASGASSRFVRRLGGTRHFAAAAVLVSCAAIAAILFHGLRTDQATEVVVAAQEEEVSEPAVLEPAQVEWIDQVLAQLPVPPNLDVSHINLDEDPTPLAVVVGEVACAWIGNWVDSLEDGDAVRAADARLALASSRGWPAMAELDAVGDFPAAVWHYADILTEAGDAVSAVEASSLVAGYQEGLGCAQ